MIGYVTLGTNNLPRAAAFYDALADVIGASRIFATETSIVWAASEGAAIDVTLPFDGQPASVGNGVMVALRCRDNAQVDAVYRRAIELGGTCEGKPGPRPGIEGFYAGYFRDPDGNKLNAFFMPS
ncbi:glyoxalase/bleomycin resistance protein/dioxygenase superfamily protein [Dongia mobilis]|uniref:Glyoxalase/bleomycin resistance protein/dioxygenase superfamily protein n=1 Tax=Dongia mobilis TaxID=578943 RepID=A0A4R6WK55_9PROT|nr:VOC family protein [Dongia mobilis]TDQ80906.1 glyoxalase/bleomycin resistance protein/dioxygenase superfamily protein [Dongia mobilis]